MADLSFEDLARRLCDRAQSLGADFADVRVIRRRASGYMVQDGRADKLSAAIDQGVGVRVLAGRAWGFASADSLKTHRAEQCVDDAVALARASEGLVAEPGRVAAVDPIQASDIRSPEVDPEAMPAREKIERLMDFERAGRSADEARMVNSIVSYSDGRREEVLANTAGTCVRNEGARAVCTALMVASDGEIIQRGVENRGIVGGAELLDRIDPESFGRRAGEKALGLLAARPAPSGRFTVIFHPSITGLLVHEALGHNAEADAVWAGESILEGRLGDDLAPPDVSIYDDSTIDGQFGSFAYDDEGVPARKRPIIENGKLVGFLHSLETAARFDAEPTGSARAESYESRPIVRMSNTYMAPGDVAIEDMIGGIDRGIYLEDGHWGYVFVQKGQFICHAGQARMITDGKLADPLRDVSISSLTLDVLANIDAVGNEIEIAMPGMCGKDGQSAATDCGGPHVRVRDVVVGGQIGQ